MNNPQEFYKSQLEKFTLKLRILKKKIGISVTLRLSVFILTILLAYFFSDESKVLPLIILLGIFVFSFLVSRHNNLRKKKTLALYI